MSDALIQIVDENDQPIGAATKQQAWDKGLIHRIIRIVIWNAAGQILLQHRDPSKDIFPNCWDNAVGGHVDAGETYETAALREMAEELDIRGVAIRELGKYRSDEMYQNHRFNRFTQCYEATMEETPQKLEPGTIDRVAWFTVEEVRQLIKEHPEEVCDGLHYVFEHYYKEQSSSERRAAA
ncbi:MAG TPA: NUDIX domain-containing protein [Patescibacteria group bacterium]|nr:NUDIX domain-containing protein [Patescibacteria group bacterium]